MPNIIDIAADFRQSLIDLDKVAIGQMTRRWLSVEKLLLPDIEVLVAQVQALKETGATAEQIRWRLLRLDSYNTLLAQIGQQIATYNREMEPGIEETAVSAQELARQHAAELVNAVSNGEVSIATNLPTGAVQNIAAIARAGQPLYNLLQNAYPTAVQGITNELIYGTVIGRNPRETARQIVRKGMAPGLNHVLLVARDQQIRNYREMTRTLYDRSDVISGYVRLAAKNRRTCFIAGTLVTTADGEMPIEKISRGTLVQTHEGLRPVTNTMRSKYSAEIITLEVNGKEIVCTADHPIWISREGRWCWSLASDVLRGDKVVICEQGDQHLANNGRDSSCSFPSQVDRPITLPGQHGIAPFLFGGVLMPVPSITFERNIVWQHEVDGEVSARNLLPIRDIKFVQHFCAGNLQGRNIVGAVAMGITKIIGFKLRRNFPKPLPAIFAVDKLRGAVAKFATVVSSTLFAIKQFPATFAWFDKRLWSAGAAFDSIGRTLQIGTPNHKDFSARPASRLDFRPVQFVAVAGTKSLVRSAGWSLECLATLFAGIVDAVPLSYTHAFSAACSTIRVDQTGRFREGFVADEAPKIHTGIISSVDSRVKKNVFVYNLEVEDAHTYFANGILVHNCLACLALDGTIYETSEVMALHPIDRCSQIPIVKGFPLPRFQTGEEWFKNQSPAVQLEMMGKKRLEAWQNGRFQFKQLATVGEHEVWGPTAQVTAVADLLKGGGGRGSGNGKRPAVPVEITTPEPKRPSAEEARIAVAEANEQFSSKLTQAENGVTSAQAQFKNAMITQNEFIASSRGLKAAKARTEWADIEGATTTAVANVSAAKALVDAISQERSIALRSALRVDNPAKIEIEYASKFAKGDGRKTAVETGVAEFENLVDASLIDFPLSVKKGGGGRSFFSPSGNDINMTVSAGAKTVVHEMGHWLEHNNTAVREAVHEFYRQRTKDEPPIPLSRATGNVSYRSNEKTLVDKFIDPYMGKIYTNRDGEIYATEILSMGLELYYKDPIRLATEDPEYFDFIYNVVRGDL